MPNSTSAHEQDTSEEPVLPAANSITAGNINLPHVRINRKKMYAWVYLDLDLTYQELTEQGAGKIKEMLKANHERHKEARGIYAGSTLPRIRVHKAFVERIAEQLWDIAKDPDIVRKYHSRQDT